MTSKIETLIDKINALAEQTEENALSENSLHYEFCSSWCYNEADFSQLHLISLDDETQDAIKEAIKKHGETKVFEVIKDHSTCELEESIRAGSNEVFSVSIGEIKTELDDDLKNELDSLNEDDLKRVKSKIDCYIPQNNKYFYVNLSDSRFYMRLNDDQSFFDALKGL